MQKIHDEQNAKILSQDRINIIDFSLCLRLPYAPYSTAAVQSSFNILVFCHHRLFLHFDFCKYGLEILFVLISEIWGSALNFMTKGKCLTLLSCLVLVSSIFLLLSCESPNSSCLSFAASGQREGTQKLVPLNRQSCFCLRTFPTGPGFIVYYILGSFHVPVPSRPNPVINWNLPACDPTLPLAESPAELPCQLFFSSSGGTDSS